uniref:Uncharacterized protein n=1 Tax=Romanomermis culicivorax TaxID=13658 RepID=A0A915HZ66_ROMCU
MERSATILPRTGASLAATQAAAPVPGPGPGTTLTLTKAKSESKKAAPRGECISFVTFSLLQENRREYLVASLNLYEMSTPADNLHIKNPQICTEPRRKGFSVVLTHLKTKPEVIRSMTHFCPTNQIDDSSRWGDDNWSTVNWSTVNWSTKTISRPSIGRPSMSRLRQLVDGKLVDYDYWSTLWPLFFLMGTVGSGILFMAFWSFRKLEVVVNHRKPAPLSWERARDVAYSHRWRLGDVITGRMTGERIPELDKLQDEMLQIQREREAKRAAEKQHHGHGAHH